MTESTCLGRRLLSEPRRKVRSEGEQMDKSRVHDDAAPGGGRGRSQRVRSSLLLFQQFLTKLRPHNDSHFVHNVWT